MTDLGRQYQIRFSPACAGNAVVEIAETAHEAVQPRVCGERPPVAVTNLRVLRFSPACAGNASSQSRKASSKAVQPRVCGERDGIPRWRTEENGSAPRVRGTQWRSLIFTSVMRFSPACAGNAAATRLPRMSMAVQPRVCGERGTNHLRDEARGGSAPRVRGTPLEVQPRSARCRFSPACAGNAEREDGKHMSITVQPRVCGERNIPRSPAKMSLGSAPRVRGTRGSTECQDHPRRFSPACAGNAYRCGL